MLPRSLCRALPLLLIIQWGLAQGAVSVVDDGGRTLSLPAPAQRIVSLAPHLTENLYAAGAGGRIVAAVDFSDWPPEAKKLPRLGSFAKVDVESILAYKPDLVVTWQSGVPPAQIARLQTLGIPVYFSQPRLIDDVAKEIERLGVLAGSASTAQQAAQAFRQRQAQLQARYAKRPKLRVFYQIWHQPLMTINGAHLISNVMQLCGGENVFANLTGLAASVSEEAVLAANPEVLIASGMDEARPEWLDAWRRWTQLTATARHNLFFIPPDLVQRHTVRILDGAEMLCRHLETARGRRALKE